MIIMIVSLGGVDSVEGSFSSGVEQIRACIAVGLSKCKRTGGGGFTKSRITASWALLPPVAYNATITIRNAPNPVPLKREQKWEGCAPRGH